MAELLTVQDSVASVHDGILVKDETTGDHYIVSTATPPWTGQSETLVFPADAEGGITDFVQVAGGKGMSREDALADLSARLDEGKLQAKEDVLADWRESGDMDTFLSYLGGAQV